jgi:hypothetical protein
VPKPGGRLLAGRDGVGVEVIGDDPEQAQQQGRPRLAEARVQKYSFQNR